MGADGFWSIQYKNETANEFMWAEIFGCVDRDYDLFGLLNGIRGGDPLYSVKGLPPNYESHRSSPCEPTWFTLEEARNLSMEYRRRFMIWSRQWDRIVKFMLLLNKEFDNVRIIFYTDQG